MRDRQAVKETEREQLGGGGQLCSPGMFCYFQIRASLLTLNQTLYVRRKAARGPFHLRGGAFVCASRPLTPFIVSQYWFRNKSGRLIQWSTFPNKPARRSCCVWRAAPHGAVFIVSPPPKINEKFPDGESGCEERKYWAQGGSGKASPTGSV